MNSKERRKLLHKCVRCGTPTELKSDGTYYVVCAACRQRIVKREKAVTEKCKAAHICADCGKDTEQKPDGSYYVLCAACRSWRRNKYKVDWRY